ALLEDLALYDNESWNDPRDFAKSVKAIFMPHDVPSTSDRHVLELEDQIKYLMRKPKASSTQPPPCQANVDKDEKHEEFVDKNMVKLNKDVNNPVETSDEPIRKANKESIGEERKMVELPEPQPVSFYLNHNINEKLIGGLIGNVRLTDEKLVETDVRLALVSNSHIYPLGVAEDVLIEEEKIKLHHIKELEFEAWKSKYYKSKALAPKDESSGGTSENHSGGVT
ncbi:hypothetical protein Tco_0664223, partial [Tanacetum coccineum]